MYFSVATAIKVARMLHYDRYAPELKEMFADAVFAKT